MVKELNKNSLMYWFPRTKSLGIRVPATHVLKIPQKEFEGILDREGFTNNFRNKIVKIVNKLGYPVFVRTDQASGKHDWKETCFIKNHFTLFKNIHNVILFNFSAGFVGLPFKALVFREFIPLHTRFTAFSGDMPIGKERRYFINEGKVVCHHPYWPEDAIYNANRVDWKIVLKELNKESEEEISLLTSHAEKVGKVLKGFWSVDFALTDKDEWILIDMAQGIDSWHPKDCHNYKEKKEGDELAT